MARRRKQLTIPPALFFKFAASIVAIGLAVSVVGQIGRGLTSGSILILLIGAGTVAAFVIPRVTARRAVSEKVTYALIVHMDALKRKRFQLLQPDDYGANQPDRWFKEIEYFLRTQVQPNLRGQEASMFAREGHSWRLLVDNSVAAAQASAPAFANFSPKMTPGEFEAFCAQELKSAGWNARVTKGSRDQGVDVVATKNGRRLVLQCKLYSQPVGNKAVQEVVAAKGHERAQFGAVVTNNRYTSAAQDLANTNSVLLLHYSDLRNVENMLPPIQTRTAATDQN